MSVFNKLTTSQAAAFLGLSKSLLNKMRLRGNGPAFLKFGRAVRYDLATLEAWAASRSRKSTSEVA